MALASNLLMTAFAVYYFRKVLTAGGTNAKQTPGNKDDG